MSKIEFSLSKLYEPFRTKRKEFSYRKRNIEIVVLGTEPKEGLVVLTHPTIDDTNITRIALPNSFSAVDAENLSFPDHPRLSRFKSIVLGAMIPVYRGNSEKRQITYSLAAKLLNMGKIVCISPTGLHNGKYSSEIPEASELHMGGIIKILRTASNHNSHITPAVRHIDQENIVNGAIARGSTMYIIYGEPIPVPEFLKGNQQINEEDLLAFAQSIVDSWQAAKLKLNDINQEAKVAL